MRGAEHDQLRPQHLPHRLPEEDRPTDASHPFQGQMLHGERSDLNFSVRCVYNLVVCWALLLPLHGENNRSNDNKGIFKEQNFVR